MRVANFHIPVPAWAMLTMMAGDVGLTTFGDPGVIWSMPWVTPLFKAVVAMFGVVLAVCAVTQNNPSPAMP